MIEYTLLTLSALLALFIAFAFIMELKVEFEGTRYYPAIKIIFGIPFLIADCLVNWMLCPFFIDLPRHPLELVTGRMTRYKKIGVQRSKNHTVMRAQSRMTRLNRWRYRFAVWLCNHLNRHDAGHC